MKRAYLRGLREKLTSVCRGGYQAQFNRRSLSDATICAADHPWFKQLPQAPESFRPEERVLTLLSANITAGRYADVAQDWRHLPPAWHEAGMEVVLQTHLHAGFARTINGLATVHEVGVQCATPTWSEEVPDLDRWSDAGDQTAQLIYGHIYPKLRGRMRELHPVLDNIMFGHAYGRLLSRPGLDLRVRELCIIAMLIGLNAAPQLTSHLRGALRVGATEAEVRTVVAQTSITFGEEAQAQADATLVKVMTGSVGQARS